MLIFRYSKLHGAEYISHLDTLRHIGKTLMRAKIKVEFSKGFNPHIEINMSPPIFVGLASNSEYCLVETDEAPESFMEKFNKFSPKGIKCISAFGVSKKYKIAGEIDSAKYAIKNVPWFDVNDILSQEEFFMTIKGEQKEVRKKIISLEFNADNELIAQLSFGNNVLRADCFMDYLKEKYGGNPTAFKLQSFVQGKLPEEIYN